MRKNKADKRYIALDPKFKDEMVTVFVNNLMLNGKKDLSYKIFYKALDIVGEKLQKEEKSPLEIWKKALDNITPAVEVRSRRVGGATFQVPQEVRADRKRSISYKNMIKYARQRSGKSMHEKLAGEIIAAYNEEGGAYRKKIDTHKMADANKAFSHFRF